MATEAGTVQVVMPAMGDSVAEGTVLEWRKQEGDPICADETIVEISTDKVDAEVPAPVGGRLAKILAAEGETIAVGAPLAEIATGDGNGAEPAVGERPLETSASPDATSADQAGNGGAPEEASDTEPSVERDPEGQEASPAESASPTASADSEAPARVIDIVTPTGGESVTEGTILEWTVPVGESVKQGDTVVVVSTDKVDMELPAPGSGTVSEILAEEGATVTVGQVIGRVTTQASSRQPPPEAEAPQRPRRHQRRRPPQRRPHPVFPTRARRQRKTITSLRPTPATFRR